MLTRDFVQAFILGQVLAGTSQDQAKANFQTWLENQDDSIATESEARLIISDLASYTVAQKEG